MGNQHLYKIRLLCALVPTFSGALKQLNSDSAETLQPANITFVAQKFLSAKVRFIQYKQFVKITAFYIYKIL